MAEAPKKDTKENETGVEAKPAAKQAGAESRQMGIRLVPVENSDQPVFANYCNINVSPGMAFIDFGFFEPGMLAALPRMAKSGGKMPETISGRLAVRVAMGFDGLQNLHQQLGRVISGLQATSSAKK